MFQYYRKPFVAALILFGAIQMYGSGAFTQSNKSTPTETSQPQMQQKESPSVEEVTLDSESSKDDIQGASSSLTKIKDTFSGKINSATPSQATEDKVFAALQKEMDKTDGKTGSALIGSENSYDSDTSTTQSFGQMLISLAFVILMVLAFAWLAKKFIAKNRSFGGGFIEVLGSHSLSQKSKVHLVQVGYERFLIGEGNNSVSLISKVESELPAPKEEVSPIQNEEESRHMASFDNRLNEWQTALQGGTVHRELADSLSILGGLTKRLRRKKVQDHG